MDKKPSQEKARIAGLINFEEYVKGNEKIMDKFQLITGGKEPPNERWLEDMEIGTIFLVTEKQSNSFLAPCFIILDKTDVAIKLGSGSIPNPEWVVPHKFRLKYVLLEVQGIYKDDNIRKIEEVENKYKDTKDTIDNPEETL